MFREADIRAYDAERDARAASLDPTLPLRQRVRARTREGTARRASGPAARAAKRRIPAHDLAYQPILGRRLGSSGLAGQGAGDVPVLKNNQRKSNGRCSRGNLP